MVALILLARILVLVLALVVVTILKVLIAILTLIVFILILVVVPGVCLWGIIGHSSLAPGCFFVGLACLGVFLDFLPFFLEYYSDFLFLRLLDLATFFSLPLLELSLVVEPLLDSLLSVESLSLELELDSLS